MMVGITLPQFRDEADSAIAAARRAESLGLDGVFCFDHLWPMGQPGRPAISSGPLLGALAASTSSIRVGTLVARIGLLPDEVLVAELSSLAAISGGRLIAGLGTGDQLSRAENDAFGLPFEPAGVRRVRLRTVAVALAARGIPVWVAGGLPFTTDLARAVGGAANLWEGETLRVAELTAAGVEVTWGGPVDGDADDVRRRLEELAAAGATWAVCAWPGSLEVIAAAAESVR
ncbi:MAG: LLM class flavin-dependent oxidoreductase [Acidimicrobiales bacterium]|jgi:alkanesulfonate monooxygenase SsuD/methylene tetrahydromethanopterin reductase-like flavin-dependent oxidoreductase (luciferase family)